MGTATIDGGVRRMRFVSLLDRQEWGEITQKEAAETQGRSVRTFQRWVERYAQEGEAGSATVGSASCRRSERLRRRSSECSASTATSTPISR